jgi:DNA/RNA endonuclease YhcR with UshA esterase domain
MPSGAIDWSEAYSYIGSKKTVYGTVQGVNYATGSKGKPTFINIGVNYPNTDRVTALIWNDYRGNFSPSPESLYSGKTICVTGYLENYQGVAQIQVTSPSQISVLD